MLAKSSTQSHSQLTADSFWAGRDERRHLQPSTLSSHPTTAQPRSHQRARNCISHSSEREREREGETSIVTGGCTDCEALYFCCSLCTSGSLFFFPLALRSALCSYLHRMFLSPARTVSRNCLWDACVRRGGGGQVRVGKRVLFHRCVNPSHAHSSLSPQCSARCGMLKRWVAGSWVP